MIRVDFSSELIGEGAGNLSPLGVSIVVGVELDAAEADEVNVLGYRIVALLGYEGADVLEKMLQRASAS